MENLSQPSTPTPAAELPADAPPDLSGQTLGDFRLIRRIGQGGMGQVYLAEQLSLKRKIALKIMRADLAANPTALTRFKKEAEASARVTHANIVQVFAIGFSDGLHYMALEYVEGKTLRDFIAKKGTPDLPLAMNLMRQVGLALQEAHEAGVVHRDIKPENILLTKKGEVKVADFGLSRCFGGDEQPLNLTQSGVSMGTPLYMSPEQVQGKEVDPRTDLYSFGVTCYHMLTGQPPFRGQSAFDVALQHVQKDPTPLREMRPDLPAELCAVVHKLMCKDVASRYQSANDFLVDLGRLRDGQTNVISTADIVMAMAQTGSIGPASATRTPPLAMPVLVAPHRPWGRTLLLALSLLLALLAGIGWRLLAGNTPATKPAPATELSAGQEAVRIGPTSREATLQAIVKKEVNRTEQEEVRKHLDAAIQLAQLYIDARRLTDAETYFKELREKPAGDMKVFTALGRIGQGVVLAYQDKPEESIKVFQQIEKDRPAFEKGKGGFGDGRQFFGRVGGAEWYLMNQPAVRRMVAEALNYNAANLGKPLPPELEKLRRIPMGKQ